MNLTRRTTDAIIQNVLQANNIPEDDHKRFLKPSYTEIAGTYDQFPHINLATIRVQEAVLKKERVLVWGDFDVDGLTATAIMVRTLRRLGLKPEWHVPDRKVEGHGLNRAGVKKECSNRDLMITVDCGIDNYQEIKYAQHLGCDVIVTDHHLHRERLPSCHAVLHVHEDMPTRFSGAGVAFKFAQALLADVDPDYAQSLLWLAMLGTVVDCVSQTHENRVISALGLQQINESTPACIRALALETDMKRPINKNQISWKLGPILNSASRLGMAQVAQDILLAEEQDTQKILGLASQLQSINTERKDMLEQFYQLGLEKSQQQPVENSAIAVVFDIKKDGDPRGIQGILAARLADAHLGIPAFVFTDVGDGILVGSARTPRHEFPRILDNVQDLIIGGGGHHTVGGLSLYTENLREFVEMVDNNFFSAMYPADERDKGAELHVSEIDMELYNALSVLEPYGHGDSPLFQIECKLTGEHRIMGQEQNHIKFEITDGAQTCQVLFWNKAGDMEQCFRSPEYRGATYIVRGRLKLNDWGGANNIELEATEIVHTYYDENGDKNEVSL